MTLSEHDRRTLEKIAAVDGDCLRYGLCTHCPFRMQCLPQFLNEVPPSREHRLRMALDVLLHDAIFEEALT